MVGNKCTHPSSIADTSGVCLSTGDAEEPISSERKWHMCGTRLVFRAESRGKLELLLNDGGIHVHNGRFGINVMVQP